MGFFSGRVTMARYRVQSQPPLLFGPDELERLANNGAGRTRVAAGDGIEVGWSAGDHILDLRFDLAKNIINDMLHFAMRIDQNRLPGDLLRAYIQVDLEALAAGNPSGKPSTKQKREARESARERLEDEAKDGRFLKRKLMPCCWDRRNNELWFGSTSTSQFDRLSALFQGTFGCGLEPITAGRRAFRLAEMHNLTRNVDDAQPSVFVPGTSPSEYAWVVDEMSRDFLGNEFLLWLWFTLDCDRDVIKLLDNSEVSVMIARHLTLDCPRGATGNETINSDGPTRLPEARRAIQAGKIPRKAGLSLVRHEETYEFTLHAETLGIGSAKLPPIADEDLDEFGIKNARADQLRHLVETVDLLFDAFVRMRLGADWSRELARMQKWLAREERPRVSAAG